MVVPLRLFSCPDLPCFCAVHLVAYVAQPNAIARIVAIDNTTKKIIIIAKRHITRGEEVRYPRIS